MIYTSMVYLKIDGYKPQDIGTFESMLNKELDIIQKEGKYEVKDIKYSSNESYLSALIMYDKY